jgi:hypothetical protein
VRPGRDRDTASDRGAAPDWWSLAPSRHISGPSRRVSLVARIVGVALIFAAALGVGVDGWTGRVALALAGIAAFVVPSDFGTERGLGAREIVSGAALGLAIVLLGTEVLV